MTTAITHLDFGEFPKSGDSAHLALSRSPTKGPSESASSVDARLPVSHQCGVLWPSAFPCGEYRVLPLSRTWGDHSVS